MGCGVNARRIGVLVALVVMGASGWYVFVYLYRWEWNRALVSGIIFLAAEIGLLGAALFDRLSKLDRKIDDLDSRRSEPDPRVLRRIQESAPEPANPFAWMGRPESQANVFVPVLMGAGAVLSALAWAVDRIARATATPAMEKGLARSLSSLQPLPGGLLGEAPNNPFHPR
jgi:hypothetical protein